MAISDFGESLLSKQRERQEKEQRKADRQAILGTAATVGIGLYRNNLKKKQEEFLKSQPVLTQQAIRSNADTTATAIFKREDDIASYGAGAREDFFVDPIIEVLKRKALQADPTLRRAIELGAMDVKFREEALTLARPKLARHDKAYAAAKTYRTSPSFTSELEVANKTPESAFEGVMSLGKDRVTLERETIEAYKKSTGAKKAQFVLDLEDAFRSTRDLVTAYEFADADLVLTKEQQVPFVSTKIERLETTRPQADGSELKGYVRKKVVSNEITQDTRAIEEKFVPYLSQEEIAADKDRAAVKSLNSSFNIYKAAVTNLAPGSQQKFKTEAEKKLQDAGVPKQRIAAELLNPSTRSNYDLLADTYNSFGFTKEDYKADLDDRTIEVISRSIANSPQVQARIDGLQQEYDNKERESYNTGQPIDPLWIQNWQRRLDSITYTSRITVVNNSALTNAP